MAKANRRPQNKKLKAKKRKESTRRKEAGKNVDDEIIRQLTHALGLHVKGQHATAEMMCKNLLAANPNHPEIYSLLGIIAHNTGRMIDAVSYHRKSTELNPKNGNYLSNLGASLNKSGRAAEAIEVYKKAVELSPNNEQVYFNMAIALRALGMIEEAIDCYEKVLEINPQHAKANYNLANALENTGRTEQALAHHQKVQLIDPTHAKARYNKALLNLRLGNFKEGFKDYELRWLQEDAHEFPGRLKDTPIWDGSDLTDKTLLIYGEQGLGDVLQFARFIPIIKAQKNPKKITVRWHPPLNRLFSCMKEIDEFSQTSEPIPQFDELAPILSLPYIMRTDLDTVPKNVPYVKADEELVRKWRSEIKADSKLNIGIVWAGAAGHKNDYNRSCALAMFESLMDLPETYFYSLQKGRGEQELAAAIGRRNNLIDLGSKISDFSDTAAIMENLDLVISVDTAPVHLAGALGRPVWTLLPFVPDWRWLTEREDSPWYPTMRLFRQRRIGDWQRVFESVKRELVEILRQKGMNIRIIDQTTKDINEQLAHAYRIHKDDPVAAEEICKRVLEEFPENPDAHCALGLIFQHTKDYLRSIDHLQRAVKINPRRGDYLTNLGSAFEKAGKTEQAIDCHKKAIAINKDIYHFHYNLALAYRAAGKNSEAIEELKISTKINPEHLDSFFVLGGLLQISGHYDEALKNFNRALEINPNDKRSIYNRSHIHLMRGNWGQGFGDYETRYEQPELQSLPDFVEGKPMWDGGNFSGKTLLLHAEQGFGDMIQFIRFLPQVKKLGGKIVAECHGPLLGFMKQVAEVDEWLEDGKAIPHFDLHAAILSLPHLLGTTPETIPAEIPYLKADDRKIAEWKPVLEGGGRKIGFVIAGRPNHFNDLNRSCSLDDFKKIFDVKGATFFSLQKGRYEDEIKKLAANRGNLVELGSRIKNFSDTAAIISQLDLVISVDTSAVHLAGALGKPVWTLLPRVPDWRWFLDREDSPWYPTMRLFRQEKDKDWEGVFARVKKELENFIIGSGSENCSPDILQEAFMNFQSGNFEDAEKLCRESIKNNQENCEAHNLLSVILQKADRNDEALSEIEKATRSDPDNKSYRANMIKLLLKMTQSLMDEKLYDDAIKHVERILQIEQNNFDALILGAAIEQKRRNVPQVISYYDRALEIDGNHKQCIYNRAIALLLSGDLKKGFIGYEERWKSLDYLGFPNVAKNMPLWNGEGLNKKTIFLHTEQGFGDAIQFIRFVPSVKRFGGKIVVGCKRELHDLFAPILPEATWVAEGNPVPDFDLHAPVMSLPRILGATLETIPNDVPYIFAPEEKKKKWQGKIAEEKFSVGIVWSGNQKFPGNEERSCKLHFFETLFDMDGINFYSLQKGSGEDELQDAMTRHDNLYDMGKMISDFGDTAAILDQLDLLISTDTSVPHLAGAMARPVWLLAAYVPDWRWLLDRSDSPWYPSMRIFRQDSSGDWSPSIEKIKHELIRLVENR